MNTSQRPATGDGAADVDGSRIEERLGRVDHRPFPVPRGRWRFYQEWRDVVFLHYRVDPALLDDVVPPGLALDLEDGAAWVSVVVFQMRNVRIRGLPAVPPVSRFLEANVRTYVRRDAYPGVYFLDILASSRLASFLARLVSRLPYRRARIHRAEDAIRIGGREAERLVIEYTPGGRIKDPTPTDRWLTERYALHQDDGGRIRSFNVHHPPWPLRRLELRSLTGAPLLGRIDLADRAVAHYSDGVPVLAWPGTVAAPTW